MANKSLAEKIEELINGQGTSTTSSFQSSGECSHCTHCRSKTSRKRPRSSENENGREERLSTSNVDRSKLSIKHTSRFSKFLNDSDSDSDSDIIDSSLSTSDSDSDIGLTAKQMRKLSRISNKKLLLRLIATNKKLIASNKKVVTSNKQLAKIINKYHRNLSDHTEKRFSASHYTSNVNGKYIVPDAETLGSPLEREEEASPEITPIPEQLLLQESQETSSEDAIRHHFGGLIPLEKNSDPVEANRLARFAQAAARARKTKISLFVGDMMNTLYTKEYLITHCLSGSKTKSSMDTRDITDIEGFVRRYFPLLCQCDTVNPLNCPCFSNEVVKAIKTRFHNSSRLSLPYTNALTSPCNPNESSSSLNN